MCYTRVMAALRDSTTGRFLPGPKVCTCGSGQCAYHREATRCSYKKHQERRRADSRAYYRAHKERMREQNKEWILENKDFDRRRSSLRRRTGARLKKQEYQAVMDYYRPLCVYCGIPTTGIDHLTPLVNGGSGNDFYNMAPCCPLCNSIKGARPIWVMLGREEVMMRVTAQ